ncbi:hypothetical protein FSP39_024911 [Pinctada imbricata]|uniref:Uncharacterized protein n=1 Tax=Pinctada imbricata TaxID=66713 RepID=A0AA88Y1M6_PINIB|nr:hypothetical protein FSP39_024911 [Pinctada imbricata]
MKVQRRVKERRKHVKQASSEEGETSSRTHPVDAVRHQRRALIQLGSRLEEVRSILMAQRSTNRQRTENNSSEMDMEDGGEDEDVEMEDEPDYGAVKNEEDSKTNETDDQTDEKESHQEENGIGHFDADNCEWENDTVSFPRPIISVGRPKGTNRCLSSTSADTSETSGIGSLSEASALGDDHFDTELGHSPISKPSPGGSSTDESVVEPALEEADIDKEVKCELQPKEPYIDHMKINMQSKIDQLPLPEALKQYLMYYRR